MHWRDDGHSWMLARGPALYYLRKPFSRLESKTRTYHERFGTGRRGAERGEAWGRGGTGRGASKFPGHALHEKGLHRQKGGVVPLVGSQDQRALLVSLINR